MTKQPILSIGAKKGITPGSIEKIMQRRTTSTKVTTERTIWSLSLLECPLTKCWYMAGSSLRDSRFTFPFWQGSNLIISQLASCRITSAFTELGLVFLSNSAFPTFFHSRRLDLRCCVHNPMTEASKRFWSARYRSPLSLLRTDVACANNK